MGSDRFQSQLPSYADSAATSDWKTGVAYPGDEEPSAARSLYNCHIGVSRPASERSVGTQNNELEVVKSHTSDLTHSTLASMVLLLCSWV
jgi:hypothetical protein